MEHGGRSVFAGVGERTREGNDLWLEMKESGVLESTALVYGQMNEPPGARLRVGLSALTVAEYFRDVEKQDVLLFIDNIFRLHPGGLRGLGPSGTHALGGWLPADAGNGDGRAPGAHHLHPRGFDHFRPGHLRARGRPDRPGSRGRLRPPGRHDGPFPVHLGEGHLPGRGPARLLLPHPRPAVHRRAALRGGGPASRRFCSATRTCRTSSPSWAWTS